MVKFKILSENRDNMQFKGEAGLCVFIDVFGNKFLMDTGLSDLFIKNAKLLNLELENIKKIILTHGHNDHSGGVQFLKDKEIIMHPLAFKPRWSIRRKEFVGFPQSLQELKQCNNVVLKKQSFEFYKNCYFLGEIPMIIDFERDGNFATTLNEQLTMIDKTEDDSGIAITTNKGLFIMIGCGHRGICNVIEHAKKVTGENRIYGVFGGFHLRNLEKQKDKINQTIEYIKHNNVQELYLGHCVTDEVIDYFEQNLKNVKIIRLSSGKEYNLNLEPYIEKI